MHRGSDTASAAAAKRSGGGWSDYWATDGASGEVFVNSAGEKHPGLATFWREALADLPEPSRIIDVASGAGSIFGCLTKPSAHALHAVDISAEALALLRRRFPGAVTVVAGADRLPFVDGSFDAVVSQFGVEYAGRDAVAAAGGLVAPGGRLVMLCHYRDGYIDSRNRDQLAAAELARDSGFVELAIALAEATFAADTARQETAARRFAPAERALAEAVRGQPQGVHAHLYLGFRRLYENRHAYRPADVVGWLRQMRGEVDKSIYRLSNIIAVALSDSDTRTIAAALAARSLEAVSFQPFATAAGERPIAWQLTARGRGR